MDNSFNTLIRSLRDNYLQYKITGSASHKQSYESAEQGIQNILKNLESSVKSEDAQISDFYKKDVQGKLHSLRDQTQTLHSTLLKEDDDLTAAKLRHGTQGPAMPNLLPQYIAVGVLGGLTLLLMFL